MTLGERMQPHRILSKHIKFGHWQCMWGRSPATCGPKPPLMCKLVFLPHIPANPWLHKLSTRLLYPTLRISLNKMILCPGGPFSRNRPDQTWLWSMQMQLIFQSWLFDPIFCCFSRPSPVINHKIINCYNWWRSQIEETRKKGKMHLWSRLERLVDLLTPLTLALRKKQRLEMERVRIWSIFGEYNLSPKCFVLLGCRQHRCDNSHKLTFCFRPNSVASPAMRWQSAWK